MKALVTGGAGFIGSHIAERLLSMGADVYVIDDFSAGKRKNIPEGAELIRGDVSDLILYAKLKGMGIRFDAIFHNAASKKNICLKNPPRDLQVNGEGTLRLLRYARETEVKKFVHASTGSVYGIVNGLITECTPTNPVSYYGISKLAGESYVRYFSKYIDTTVLRYFHVYGDRQEDDSDLGGVVAIFKRLISEGKKITIHGTGNQERLFTHVDDIVEANIKVRQDPRSRGQVYNCASDKKTTINELAEMLGAKGIEYAEPLEGDIFSFDVSSEKIAELGVEFRGFTYI